MFVSMRLRFVRGRSVLRALCAVGVSQVLFYLIWSTCSMCCMCFAWCVLLGLDVVFAPEVLLALLDLLVSNVNVFYLFCELQVS